MSDSKIEIKKKSFLFGDDFEERRGSAKGGRVLKGVAGRGNSVVESLVVDQLMANHMIVAVARFSKRNHVRQTTIDLD